MKMVLQFFGGRGVSSSRSSNGRSVHMPELTGGTPRQIAFAGKIRNGFKSYMDDVQERYDEFLEAQKAAEKYKKYKIKGRQNVVKDAPEEAKKAYKKMRMLANGLEEVESKPDSRNLYGLHYLAYGEDWIKANKGWLSGKTPAERNPYAEKMQKLQRRKFNAYSKREVEKIFQRARKTLNSKNDAIYWIDRFYGNDGSISQEWAYRNILGYLK